MTGRQLSGAGARKASVSRALTRGGKNKRHPARISAGRIILVGALVLATLKLVQVQAIDGPRLVSAAEGQRSTQVVIPAMRGSITDDKGTKLAFSVDSVALTARPKALRLQWDQAQKTKAGNGGGAGVSYDDHAAQMADFLHQRLGDAVNQQDLTNELRSNRTFVYLDEQVDPPTAQAIKAKYPDIGQEKRSVREYPAGNVGSNIIGVANWRKDKTPPGVQGLAGLENSMNAQLAGKAGSEQMDTGNGSDVVIPGTERNVHAAVPGENVQLTIDSDVQYKAQQLLAQYRDKVKAQDGSLAVLDSQTGQVVALANDKAFDPNDLSHLNPDEMGNEAISSPFEPGSVGKMITAAGALEKGVVQPNSVLTVPGSIKVADRTVHDDWSHPTQQFTFTGVLAKSSNVGTLEVADKLGKDPFADYLQRFGLGQRTGIELPGESPGLVPARSKWSASTFGNLPFGQGYSMTVLQMASAYQTIANGGVRVPPRIIKSTTGPDGQVHPSVAPKPIPVVSKNTADTLVKMLRSVTQDEPSPNRGTAVSAALDGYQIAGKTGTAQQVDPKTKAYSDSAYWTTFAGVLPADHPRFVMAIMLDKPTGEGGTTAAPLFHDLASFLAQRYNLPLSNGATPTMKFVLG